MKTRTLLPVIVLVFAALACNLPSNVAATPTVAPVTLPSATNTQPAPTDLPTQTPLPTNTPLPTLTFTPGVPVASPKDLNVNCRLGPSTAWMPMSALVVGQSSQILGKTSNGNWWLIVNPQNSSGKCWVSASVVNAAGNLAPIPVAEAPQADVTNVTVNVDPKTTSVAGCVGPVMPIKIKGTIETNGPTTVKWRFETQLGGSMGNQTTDFDAFGSKDFSVDYTPPLTAGTYWVKLIVIDPNNMQAESNYRIECP